MPPLCGINIMSYLKREKSFERLKSNKNMFCRVKVLKACIMSWQTLFFTVYYLFSFPSSQLQRCLFIYFLQHRHCSGTTTQHRELCVRPFKAEVSVFPNIFPQHIHTSFQITIYKGPGKQTNIPEEH